MQFEILILISTLSLTIADVIIPPEYTRSYLQYQPIDRQFYFVPNQYRTSDYFYYGQPTFIPIYLNEPQVNNQEDSNPLLGTPQNSEIVSRVGIPKHLHALKIGGHKIVKPSYVINKLQAVPPSTILRRSKKSVENQPDSGKTGERNTVQPNSSLNVQTTMSTDNENQNPNSIVIKDKEKQATEFKNYPTTFKTLFDLNPQNLIPNPSIPSNNQETLNPINLQDFKTESNLPNARDIDVDKEISKFENLMKKPIARNFNDPRLFTIEPIITSKPMESNVQTQLSKHDELDDPITGSVQMENSNQSVKPLAQQIYPTWSPIYNYYQDPLRNNLVYPSGVYQPGVYTVYYSTDGSNKILIPKMDSNQQWSQQQQPQQQQQQQQQPCQSGMNQLIGVIPNSGYTYWPQGQYNYLSNYMLDYPKLSHYYPLSVYPNNYAPYVQNTKL